MNVAVAQLRSVTIVDICWKFPGFVTCGRGVTVARKQWFG
jgi:hypothetical protein